MGLELVETVIEVEEKFGIIVSDEAAANNRTVGQLHDYILDRRRQTQQHGCPTGHVFRDVRRVLTAAASLPRQAIRPSTELKTILPPRIRRRVWKRLQQEAQGRLRGLRLLFRLGPVLAGGCLVAGFIGTAMILPHVGVADILGVKVEEVTPSARFVEDLRAG
jgi:acyl carrier protein